MGKKRRIRKFQPVTTPRYLPGSVPRNQMMNDLEGYNKHRYSVFAAKSVVDHFPPRLNPFALLKDMTMREDVRRFDTIIKDNQKLLKNINMINRYGGRIDTFNPASCQYYSQWEAFESRLRQIEKDNRKIYKMIQAAKTSYSRDSMRDFWKRAFEKIQTRCQLKMVIFDKPDLDKALLKQPSISGPFHPIGKESKRPRCYMTFRVKNGINLGSIIIELYNDYVPITCENFLKICSEQDLTYQNCRIHRIVSDKFISTGDITHGNGRGGRSIYGKTFHEENHKLSHSKAGVLSMIRIGKNQNNSQFMITLNDMTQLDHQNVVFGKVVVGIRTIYKLGEYGKRIGKPMDEIIIHKCGVCEKNVVNKSVHSTNVEDEEIEEESSEIDTEDEVEEIEDELYEETKTAPPK